MIRCRALRKKLPRLADSSRSRYNVPDLANDREHVARSPSIVVAVGRDGFTIRTRDSDFIREVEREISYGAMERVRNAVFRPYFDLSLW